MRVVLVTEKMPTGGIMDVILYKLLATFMDAEILYSYRGEAGAA